MIERTLASVWHPCTQMKTHETFPPLPIARGEGAWLIDADGQRYLDAISSWWVNLFGHCNPTINAALRDQVERLEHVILAGFTHEPVVALSERLAALTDNRLGHCFYASDGSSAVEIAAMDATTPHTATAVGINLSMWTPLGCLSLSYLF